ncbi:hypothetical protein AU512_11170 [Lonsdalea iberica]|uniref:Uncharacterized protein n=1 Tax=Lonsdalea iberica TaxID=1082703 RepID=A0ABX3XEE3_9GAMM|nr:hypothetical protein AU512_11170 [Lonsdalea iberica]
MNVLITLRVFVVPLSEVFIEGADGTLKPLRERLIQRGLKEIAFLYLSREGGGRIDSYCDELALVFI